MKTFRPILFLALAFLVFSACTRNEDEDLQRDPIQQTKIAEGTLSSAETFPSQNLLISSEEDWKALIAALQQENPDVLHWFSETEVDFEQFQVLALIDEVRPHSSYYLSISEILETETQVEVKLQQGHTGEGFTVLSQPFYIARIAKTDKPVVFQ